MYRGSRSLSLFLANIVITVCFLCIKHTTWPLCVRRLSIRMIKTVPLQAWSGPEGSRKLRFPDFKTTAQNGGKVVSLTHWPPLPPGNVPATNFC